MAEKKKEIIVPGAQDGQREMQQKLILYQLLQRHLEELQQQAGLIERRYIELETTRQIVGDLEKHKDKADVMIPLGSGCFVNGTAEAAGKVLTEIGAGVFVRKTDEAITNFLEENKAYIEKSSDELRKEMENVIGKMNKIALEIQGMSKE